MHTTEGGRLKSRKTIKDQKEIFQFNILRLMGRSQRDLFKFVQVSFLVNCVPVISKYSAHWPCYSELSDLVCSPSIQWRSVAVSERRPEGVRGVQDLREEGVRGGCERRVWEDGVRGGCERRVWEEGVRGGCGRGCGKWVVGGRGGPRGVRRKRGCTWYLILSSFFSASSSCLSSWCLVVRIRLRDCSWRGTM